MSYTNISNWSCTKQRIKLRKFNKKGRISPAQFIKLPNRQTLDRYYQKFYWVLIKKLIPDVKKINI